MDVDTYQNGQKLITLINYFLDNGYNVYEHEGRNGGLCLRALCWSSYDQYIIDAAKLLLSAGAPVEYPSIDDNWFDESSGVLDSIEFKLAGAWSIDEDEDYSWANIIETYHQLVTAVKNNEPFEGISTYHSCIGKSLERVERIGKNPDIDGLEIGRFSEFMVLWFDGQPLVIEKYVEFVVNYNVVKMNQSRISCIDEEFKNVIGSKLLNLVYTSPSSCYLTFDNGMQLFLSSSRSSTGELFAEFEIWDDRS